MKIIHPAIGVLLLFGGLLTMTAKPSFVSQAMLFGSAAIFGLGMMAYHASTDRLKKTQKMPDACCDECPYFYDMEYQHLLKLDEVLKANSKSVSNHTHSLMTHLKYACEIWEQNEIVVRLLNALPDDSALWEDPAQARLVEDAVKEVAEAIKAQKNENGLYVLRGKK